MYFQRQLPSRHVLILLPLLVGWVVPTYGQPTATYVQVSPRDPRYFELSDGSAYIAIGVNLVPAPEPHEFEKVLDKMAENRINYCRIWLAHKYWNFEHERVGEMDEQRAQIVERFIQMARQRGIKVKVCLEYFRIIEPVTDTYWANRPLYHVSEGGPYQSMAEYVDSEQGQRHFVHKLRWVRDRFGDEPTVFAWELWNEINSIGGGDWMPWTRVMLRHTQEAFPKNLVVQSLGSFDHDGIRGVYRTLVNLPDNDVAQVHRYLDLGAPLEVCHGPVDVLAADAVRELRTMTPDRPVILTETGAVKPKHSGRSELHDKDPEGVLLHDMLFAPFFAGAAGTGHVWHWRHAVQQPDLWYHYDRFAEAVKHIDPPAERFVPSMISHPELRVYILEGESTLLVWCRDSNNTWRTELEEGVEPDVLEGVSLNLSRHIGHGPEATVRVYNPWQDRWTEVEHDDGVVMLPAFKRSIVIRCERSSGD